MLAFTPFDFHPHWHIVRPAPGYAFELPPLPILDPISRQNRRSREAEQRALSRQHNRQMLAESGRILSQFERIPRENGQARLTHCSACTPYSHVNILHNIHGFHFLLATTINSLHSIRETRLFPNLEESARELAAFAVQLAKWFLPLPLGRPTTTTTTTTSYTLAPWTQPHRPN